MELRQFDLFSLTVLMSNMRQMWPFTYTPAIYQHPTQNCMVGERGGSVVERRTPEQEVRVRNLPPLCCVLEQDTFSPKVLVIPRKRWLKYC